MGEDDDGGYNDAHGERTRDSTYPYEVAALWRHLALDGAAMTSKSLGLTISGIDDFAAERNDRHMGAIGRVIVWMGVASAFLAALAPAAVALTPADGTTYPNLVTVSGNCSLHDNDESTQRQSWLVATMDPRRVHGGDGNVELLPPTLPRREEMAALATDSLAPTPRLETFATPEASCDATPLTNHVEPSGQQAVSIRTPGPYVFMQYDYTQHWTLVPDGDQGPTLVTCPEDDAYAPVVELHPPAPVADGSWALDHTCNKVTIVRFFVTGVTGKCPVVADMSQWPTVPYINQYDAGARARLPFRFGHRGGNACGPSALLMTLLAHGARYFDVPLESLPTVFDATMQLTRSQVPFPDDPANKTANSFVKDKGVAYLKSLSFLSATAVDLKRDFASANILNLQTLAGELSNGPVIVRTAFGSYPWGLSGGGHMIEVIRTSDDATGYVVNDPAGNYFSSRTGHYGPSKCGYEVVYPSNWLKAMVVGGWLISPGPYYPALPLSPASIASLRPAALAGSATASPAPALMVYDTHPDAPDAPRSLYLQDVAGRRAGWIDGAKVSDIPFSFVDDPDPAWDDTSGGDPDLDPNPTPPLPTPRAIVLGAPQPGITLHVVADPGVPFALTSDAWLGGAPTASDALTGVGTGQDTVVRSPALEGLLPPATTPPSPPPPTPPASVAPASVAPALSRLAIRPAAFRAAAAGPSARSSAARGKSGATVRFRLTAAADVRFTVERRAEGRRVGARCVAPTARNLRARGCDRYLTVPGSFTRRATAGDTSFRFSGRMGGRALTPGSYRLVAVPTAGARTGTPVRAVFRITR